MPEPCQNHAGTVWNGLELAGIAEAARNCPKLPETARNGLKRAETG